MSTIPNSPDEARVRIEQLIELFRSNETAYKNPAYNETQTRREFIDPLFKALGWDMDNERGYAPAYKDVIHEDAIKVGGLTKAPDYCFRIGGQRKFFVEAKKPSVDMKNDPDPYYQLRRYAYSAKLPLSIVTDFEELAIVDCRAKPSPKDKASTGRIRYWRYEEYPDHLEELLDTFSPEGIKKGGLDKMATTARSKRGTGEVDKEFLREIEAWRELLARNIALRNPGLSQRELNETVQVTIDRIIFLRICEDRGIEEYGLLHGMQNGANVYARLRELFQKADERYNSGLFHFKEEPGNPSHPDVLTLGLAIDDKPLKQILKGLYYPDSPYEFSVLPIDILGQVYEQFLGKVIRLTAGHRAIVEDKPEVKKAGGVYYTPIYIVDYIVKNTVGKLLEGSTPTKAAKLRILDPACGSGSFLIGAYEYLLDWHRDWYSDNDADKWAKGKEPRLFAGKNGWQLTTAEKKRILLNNIYGVDIDPQAVEVSKLSLLLKVLEEESQETINAQLKFFHVRALPDLGNNIKCGNSLIGTDFYEGQQMGLLDEEEMYRVNAFDWDGPSGFAAIMKAGGFDAVIGNPPYVSTIGEEKSYYTSHYKVFSPTADLYVNFIEKGLQLLSKTGLFGMIVSNKWLRAAYGKGLRKYLVEENSVQQVLDFAGLPVFKATVRTIVIVAAPIPGMVTSIKYLAPVPLDEFQTIHDGQQIQALFDQNAMDIELSHLDPNGWAFLNSQVFDVMEKIKEGKVPLHKYLDRKMYRGIVTGLNKAFVIDAEQRSALVNEDAKSAEIIKPLIAGRDVRRYSIDYKEKYLIWTYIGVQIERYPVILSYLTQFQTALEKRCDKGNYWWELRACDYYQEFEKPKIIYPDIATNCRFTLDGEGFFSPNTTYFIPSEDLYLLGILNSKLANFYLATVCAGLEGSGTVYLRFFGQYLEAFPVQPIEFSEPADKSRHDQMVELVKRMLDLNKRLQKAITAHEKDSLQRQIDATDRQIDRLVYELYGLTDVEIKIVEGETSV